jgi:hypothetical protein
MVTHVSSSFTLGEFSGSTWYQCVCSILMIDPNTQCLSVIFSAREFFELLVRDPSKIPC